MQYIREKIENSFSAIYIIEFAIKVCGMGLLFNKGAYLRDYWNIIDFIIISQVITTWILNTRASKDSSFVKLNALRVLRILIPLKSLRSVEGLKVLVISLLHALPLLGDSIIILGFFYLLFALAGLHNFHGYFKNRCFYLETGQLHPQELICASDAHCPPSYICG